MSECKSFDYIFGEMEKERIRFVMFRLDDVQKLEYAESDNTYRFTVKKEDITNW